MSELIGLTGASLAGYVEGLGLIDEIEDRFKLPLTTYVVDPIGHT